jgi:hypothetical protein
MKKKRKKKRSVHTDKEVLTSSIFEMEAAPSGIDVAEVLRREKALRNNIWYELLD